MSIHTLLNPFTRIAGFSALCYGCLLMFLTAAIAAPCGVNFASSLNIHVARPMPFMPIFSLLILGWLCAATVFYFAGLLFSPSKIRAVDIYGTFALARAPFLIAAPFGLLPGLWNLDPLQTQMPPTFWIFATIALLVDIWVVILSYNAFAVSANVKNKWFFTAIFIISEIVAIVFSGLLVTWMPPMGNNPANPAAVVVGQAKEPAPEDTEHIEIAQRFVERLFAHPDENLFEELQATEKIKEFFTPDAVKHWSNKIVNDYGKLGDCVKVEVVQHNQHSRSVFLFFHGEHYPIKMWVTFNDMLISGFHYDTWKEGYAGQRKAANVLENMDVRESILWGIALTLLMIMALFLINGKGAFLIAGYNTMSKKEQAKYDEKALCRATGRFLLWIICCLIFLAFGIHNGNGDALTSLLLPGCVMGVIMVSGIVFMIYSNTGDRFLKKGDGEQFVAEESEEEKALNAKKETKQEKTGLWIMGFAAFGILAVMFSIPGLLLLGEKEPMVKILDSGIKISGLYGVKIDFTEIINISLMENTISSIGLTMRTNGYGGLSQKGYFQSNKHGSVLLFTKTNSSPTIHIQRKGKEDVFLNLSNNEATRTLYNKLKTAFARETL